MSIALTGSGIALDDVSALGAQLIAATTQGDMRTIIGAGTGTGSVTSVALSGGTTGLTSSGGPITTNGTITLAGLLVGANGGTGVANTGKTITLGGNLVTSGAFNTTLTVTGDTNVTLPTSGTLLASGGAISGTTGVFSSTLTSQAGRIKALRVVTAAGTVTVATTDHIVVVNKTVGAATTVNLPATPETGREYLVKDGKGDALVNNITVTPAAGNIDGSGTYVMNLNYQSVTLVYNGTQWNLT